MIISKTVEVTVNNNKLQFYRENGFPQCKRFDKINIPIELLGSTSKIDIECECDYCHKIFKKAYGEVLIGRKTINKDCCNECKYQKIQEINLLKYGVKTNLVLDDNKKKSQATIIKKYGVTNIMKNEIIKHKQQQSIFNKYGVTTPILNPEIKRRISQTKIEKYGYEYTKNGMLSINGVYCSKTQKEICEYFNFKINEIIDCYCVDGIKDNIIIEYNGGGHDLAIKQGTIAKDVFQKKELNRIDYLKKLGYSILIIENSLDLNLSKDNYNDIEQLLNQIKKQEIIFYQVQGSTTIENASE